MPAEQPADGYLFDLYRRYIGEPEDRTDVYVGFGLFLGGIGLAIIALLLFFWSSTFEARSAAYVTWAEPAYAIVMLALPLLMLGIVVLLPSERRVLYTSLVGVAITVVAVAGFLYAYPDDWNGYGADYTAEIVAVYAVGLAGITASTGAALIAHYLDMAQRVDAIESDDGADEEDEFSDADVRRDIDDAMEDVELSWGGVQKTEHKRLSFSEDNFDEVSVDTDAGTKTTRSTGVDAQVAGLKGLKGGEKKKTTSQSTVDDQTAKLKELREQQRAEELATADDDGVLSPLSGVVDRFRELVRRE
ncbi:permease [Natronorubrum sp. JWXQ-INN-674]|uniref:Permease n=1 Tax=Natronorubrum halalkaliphilum TaxID=2691917 RepID=A0A6B0VT75_9EURY|nr:permease [Natronorubrum halalkaliphilum]MXV64363.1 permease [Natronorubrum halalkaliphilum]